MYEVTSPSVVLDPFWVPSLVVDPTCEPVLEAEVDPVVVSEEVVRPVSVPRRSEDSDPVVLVVLVKSRFSVDEPEEESRPSDVLVKSRLSVLVVFDEPDPVPRVVKFRVSVSLLDPLEAEDDEPDSLPFELCELFSECEPLSLPEDAVDPEDELDEFDEPLSEPEDDAPVLPLLDVFWVRSSVRVELLELSESDEVRLPVSVAETVAFVAYRPARRSWRPFCGVSEKIESLSSLLVVFDELEEFSDPRVPDVPVLVTRAFALSLPLDDE